MLRALKVLAVLPLFCWLAPASGISASFDCSKASKPDERAICANPQLSQTDEELGGTYGTILPMLAGKERKQFVESQRKWIESRAQCGSDLNCLESEYESRSKKLDSILTSVQQETQVRLFRNTVQCAMCELTKADLSGMEPVKTADYGLMQCNVNGSANGTLDGARIDHADFITCNTKYASALNSMSWDNASLKGTDFTETNLGGNSFKDADLTGANLTRANLFWVDMENAKLVRANLTGATSEPDAMNGICSDFTNVDFSGANLEGANLCGSFHSANFSGAKMRKAKISGSATGVSEGEDEDDNVQYDPSSSSATSGPFEGKINLTDADLTGATIFSETKLTEGGYAFAVLCRTIMPDGTRSNRDCE